MLPFFVRALLLVAVSAPLFDSCNAAQHILEINVDSKGREYLIANQQQVAIAIASPLSESDSAIVVAFAFQPFATLTQVVFEDDVALYLSYSPVMPFDVIKISYKIMAAYGQAYSFNGVSIVGEAPNAGLDGYIAIYFDAPAHSNLSVVTGLAWFVYEHAAGKPSQPLPINYYTLNRYQTRVIPKSEPTVWVFVASDIVSGSVLPASILNPIPNGAQAFTAASYSFIQTVVPQIGNYLSVNLEAPEQSTIHFDLTKNAFDYGPLPSP